MTWTKLLTAEIETTYRATEGLIDRVMDAELDWKPSSGDNWMTTGQLLLHIASACGYCCRGFATGQWGAPPGVQPDQIPAEALPQAEQMPAVDSVARARELLAIDREMALAAIADVGEERLANESCPAPWDPTDICMGHRFLHMIQHLGSHKAQLFYYLKLQGKPVATPEFWG